VRLATFNILGGRSPTDGRVDVDRFRTAITRLDADLLALQEVDRHQPRSDHVDLTAVAAEAMGALHHRFVPALLGTPGERWTAATVAAPAGSPEYGIALLSRYDVRSWRVVRLPGAPVRLPRRRPGRWTPAWAPDEPRVAVVAEVEGPDGLLDVVATHLSFVRPWNGRQLRGLMAGLPAAPRHPLVVLGDLNMGSWRATGATGLRPLARGATYPAGRPRVQLDHVLGSAPLVPVRSEVMALPLSDHRALVADVRTDVRGAGRPDRL
jgi:endonuclease/exonuclease/phosphatase family metal-dependent hydrolase